MADPFQTSPSEVPVTVAQSGVRSETSPSDQAWTVTESNVTDQTPVERTSTSRPQRILSASGNKIRPTHVKIDVAETGGDVIEHQAKVGSPNHHKKKPHKSLGDFQAIGGRKSAKFLPNIPTQNNHTKLPHPSRVSSDKTRRRMAEQKPSVRDRLPMVRGLEGVNKADNVLADEAVGAFKKLGDDGAWNLGSNCIVRVSDKKGKKGGKKTTSKDARNECDMLTDYLMALAKPSEAEVNGTEDAPLLDVAKWYHKNWVRVYEEGYGASDGLTKNYWLQRWVEENEPDHGKCKIWRTPDNQVFHHMQPRVREFFDLGGYRAFPDVVTVEVQVRELLEVDCARGIFRVGFILAMRWYDAHFDSAKYKDRQNERVYSRSIPYITFDHVDLGDSPIGIPEDASSLDSATMHSGMATLRKGGPAGGDPPGVLYHSLRIQATFRDETDDLTLFPFDQQKLSMGMRLWGSTMRGSADEHRVLLPINVDMQLEQEHPEWITMSAECESHRPRGKRQDLEVTMHIRRRAAFFIINVALIIFLLTSMCFAVFAQSNDVQEYGDRTQTTLTLLLTTVAYKFFVNDMFPKISYLTVMDMYIFAGLVTSMSIFGLNTMTICRDYPDGCEEQRKQELGGLILIGVFWMTWNVYFAYKSIKYVRTIYWTESTKVAFSMTKNKFKKKQKMVKSLYKNAKETERDYVDSLCTVRKRRELAVKRFLEREEEELKAGKDPESFDSKRLHKNISKSQKSTSCNASRERQYRGSVVVPVADDTGIPQLLRRAALRSEEGLLAPVLEDAKLTGDMLRDLYKNGKGADALNSLLEESGVTEPSHRVSIIGALDEDGTRMERLVTNLITMYSVSENFEQSAVSNLFLVLQGAPSYLWQDLGCDNSCMPRTEFLHRIDRHLESMKNSADVTFTELRSMANCIFTRLLLTTPLLGRAEYVYSNRQVTYTRHEKGADSTYAWPTQTWTGYLTRAEGTKWHMEEEGAVLAIEVGTNKMKAGYLSTTRDSNQKLQMTCHSISSRDVASDMTRVSKLFTKSVLFSHPYMLCDPTMAHRPMLKQVLNKFGMIKTQKLESNSLFNPNKELFGFYITTSQKSPAPDGFDGTPFEMGSKRCEISLARVIEAVDRYLPGEIALMSKSLELLRPSYINREEKFVSHKIILERSQDAGLGGHAWGYSVKCADCLPDPDSRETEYTRMNKIDMAYTLLSYAMLSNEAQKTQTDHLVEVCDVLTAEWIVPTLLVTREHECAELSPQKQYSFVKRIMLFGTAELHERVIDLEKYCGLLSTEQLGAVADFCCELLRLRDPVPEGKTPYKLTFEVLSPDDQAECNHEAVKQAICCISPSTPIMSEFRRAVLDDDHHDSFGSVSWNDLGISTGTNFQGSCQGVCGRDLFTLPVGLVSVMCGMLFEADLQHSEKLTTKDLTMDLDRLRRQLSRLKTESNTASIRFADLEKAVNVVQHDLSRSLRQLNAELQPFHPAVTGPHNQYDIAKAKEAAEKWMAANT